MIKLQASGEIFEKFLLRNYCKIFKNTYFEEHLQTAASDSVRVCLCNSAVVRSPLALLGEAYINSLDMRWISETYLEPCQTSKMGLFEKIVDGWKPLTLFVKSSILDLSQDSKHASEHSEAFELTKWILNNC